uniref:Uncharacterized protein n=1 Tax=Arion vulgaris TaxID=1028688 RepID=A0A0B6YVG0_9EUPU
MGCTSSAVSPGKDEQTAEDTKQTHISKNKNHNNDSKQENRNIKSARSNDTSLHTKNHNVDKNANKLSSLAQTPVPKSITFDVTLDGLSGDGLLSIKKRPPRLQTLEPLSIPKLTSAQLQEKQRQADEKREQLKQRKINTSQRASRRRRELLEAREFELKQTEQETDEIDNKKQVELKREQHLIEIKEKQRLREERAKRARERAKQMQNPNDDVEVEKDEQFNASSDDSWLGIPDKTNNTDMEEEIGHQKKVGQSRPKGSGSTVDSYDAAFMRNTKENPNLQSVHNLQNNVHIMNDDFFDS